MQLGEGPPSSQIVPSGQLFSPAHPTEQTPPSSVMHRLPPQVAAVVHCWPTSVTAGLGFRQRPSFDLESNATHAYWPSCAHGAGLAGSQNCVHWLWGVVI